MAHVVRMIMIELKNINDKMTALYFPVYCLTPKEQVGPETRNKNSSCANQSLKFPDKYTINGDEQSVVDQNASFRKLFGFVNEKAKRAVNSYPTTPDYEWVHKPRVPNAGNILLIGQTLSFISRSK